MPTLKYKDPITGEYKSDIHVVGAVSSVNGKTGVVELTNSDIPNAITDVQINNASVVVDGVASIPVASQASIDARSSGRVPQCSDIPYAVKSAMISTTDPAWTAAEQAAARERMGAASHSWKTKQGFTLGDEYADHSAIFTLNIDEENVSEIVIYFFSNGGAGTNNYWNASGNGVRFDYLIPCYFDSTATMSISRFVGVGDITLYECDATSNGFSVSRKRGAINAKITDIKTLNTSLNGATSVLGAGTKIVVLMK